jgi:hypothetical protein
LGEKPSSSRLSHDNGSIRIQANYRRAKRAAIWARDTLRLTRLRIAIRDEAISSAEIDSYDFAHDENPEGLKPLRYKSSF